MYMYADRTRTKATRADHSRMVRENMADFRRLLGVLDDSEWDHQSLCEQWRVRDVVGHILVGTRVPVPQVVGTVTAGGGRRDRVVGRASREMGDAHTPSELRTMFEEETTRPKLRGMAGITPPKVLAADSLTHVLDVSMALDRDSGISADRKARALDLLPRLGGWGSKKRARGLRLVATDIDWNHGSGPTVRGTAEQLIVSLGGRPQFADQLGGDGALVLVERLQAA